MQHLISIKNKSFDQSSVKPRSECLNIFCFYFSKNYSTENELLFALLGLDGRIMLIKEEREREREREREEKSSRLGANLAQEKTTRNAN